MSPDLVNRAKSGSYHAPAVRRTYIEKPGKRDEKGPLGMPTTEDKLLQKGAVMILEPIFENEFYDTLSHSHLREMLRRRVRDEVLLRLIDKWLKRPRKCRSRTQSTL